MSRLDEYADKLEIQELESKYEWAVDEGRVQALADVFATDATLWFDRIGDTLDGRTSILAWFREYCDEWGWRNRRHYITNFDIRVTGTEASGRLYYLATYEAEGTSRLGWGYYEDAFVKSDGRWWIREKRINSVGVVQLDRGWHGHDQLRPSSDRWYAS